MFQPKARRIFPVFALLSLFTLVPFAEASAESTGDALSLVETMEAGIISIWDSLAGIWGDVGPRMDDNG